jgi:hypothetical protein
MFQIQLYSSFLESDYSATAQLPETHMFWFKELH